jgi:hypothetical protein
MKEIKATMNNPANTLPAELLGLFTGADVVPATLEVVVGALVVVAWREVVVGALVVVVAPGANVPVGDAELGDADDGLVVVGDELGALVDGAVLELGDTVLGEPVEAGADVEGETVVGA